MDAGRTARRVAALFDIHGNTAALDAALGDISHFDVDVIVVGGDVVWGPYPREALERLLDLGERVVFIRGNADREVAQPPDGDTAGEHEAIIEVTHFCRDRLTQDQRAWLMGLPLTETVAIDGLGAVVFCHASPRSDQEILLPTSTDESIRAAMSGIEGLVVCGHTHVQFDHDIGDIRLVNAGSVGMPYEDLSGAYWTIFGPDVSPQRTSYAIEDAVSSIRRSGCPHVEEIFLDPILNPTGRDNAIAHFTRRAESQDLQFDE